MIIKVQGQSPGSKLEANVTGKTGNGAKGQGKGCGGGGGEGGSFRSLPLGETGTATFNVEVGVGNWHVKSGQVGVEKAHMLESEEHRTLQSFRKTRSK